MKCTLHFFCVDCFYVNSQEIYNNNTKFKFRANQSKFFALNVNSNPNSRQVHIFIHKFRNLKINLKLQKLF